MRQSTKTGNFLGGHTDRFGVKYRGHEEYKALVEIDCAFCDSTIRPGESFVMTQGTGFGYSRVPSCLYCAGVRSALTNNEDMKDAYRD